MAPGISSELTTQKHLVYFLKAIKAQAPVSLVIYQLMSTRGLFPLATTHVNDDDTSPEQ